MSASTDSTTESAIGNARSAPWRALWQPAGLIYLCLMLAGLAAGLWPEAIHPTDRPAAVLPVLRTVAAAQVAYVLLAWPVVLLRRGRIGGRGFWAAAAVEALGMLAAAVPLYVLAAWFGDATVRDVLRTALYVAAVMPLAPAAAKWMSRSVWRPWVLTGLLVVALGLPAACYIVGEFVAPGPQAGLLHISPLVGAWRAAMPRGEGVLPRPVWAWVAWPLAAAVVASIAPRRGKDPKFPSAE